MKHRWLAALLLLIAAPTYAQRTASNPLGGNLSVQDAGTCSTTGSFLWQQLPVNAATTVVNLAGTFSGTLTIRLSTNGGGSWTTNSTTTTAGNTSISTNGFTDICADVTTFTSGSFAVTISTGLNTGPQGPQGPPGAGGGIGPLYINPAGVVANWKEFWASNSTINVSTGSTTITCNGCFTPGVDAGKEIVGSSNCAGSSTSADVACGLLGLPLFPASTTILSVTNSNTAVVSATPINNGSTNAYIAFGTNDDAAWNAVAAAVAAAQTCVFIQMPAGMTNFDTVNKFNSAPAACTATTSSGGKQTNVTLAENYGLTFAGYGPAVSRVILTAAFAKQMNSPGCATKACIFGAAATLVKDVGWWGAGNSIGCYDSTSCSGTAGPCNTTLNGTGTCTILGAMNGSVFINNTAGGFIGGADGTKNIIGVGGALQDGGGVFAVYDKDRFDGFGNVGVTGQNSTARDGLFLDNFRYNFYCNGLCSNNAIGYGNGANTIQGAGVGAAYTCAPPSIAGVSAPCYSTNDYLAYIVQGVAYNIFNSTTNNTDVYVDKFDTTHSSTSAAPSQATFFLCNLNNNCRFHARNSQIAVGASGDVLVSFGSNTKDIFFDDGGNTITGAIAWSGAIVADGHSAKGACTGTATSSVTLGLYPLGGTTTTCTGTTPNANPIVVTGARTLQNLFVTATAAGVSPTLSGIVTVLRNGSTTILTCTIGTGTSCVDATHTVALADGDLISIQFSTTAAETLAGVNAIVEWN